MTAKHTEILKDIVHKACVCVFKKTKGKVIFYLTTNIIPKPPSITKIDKDFPQMIANCLDFLRQSNNINRTQLRIFLKLRLSCREIQLYQSTLKTSGMHYLWIDCTIILNTQINDHCWMGGARKSKFYIPQGSCS